MKITSKSSPGNRNNEDKIFKKSNFLNFIVELDIELFEKRVTVRSFYMTWTNYCNTT